MEHDREHRKERLRRYGLGEEENNPDTTVSCVRKKGRLVDPDADFETSGAKPQKSSSDFFASARKVRQKGSRFLPDTTRSGDDYSDPDLQDFIAPEGEIEFFEPDEALPSDSSGGDAFGNDDIGSDSGDDASQNSPPVHNKKRRNQFRHPKDKGASGRKLASRASSDKYSKVKRRKREWFHLPSDSDDDDDDDRRGSFYKRVDRLRDGEEEDLEIYAQSLVGHAYSRPSKREAFKLWVQYLTTWMLEGEAFSHRVHDRHNSEYLSPLNYQYRSSIKMIEEMLTDKREMCVKSAVWGNHREFFFALQHFPELICYEVPGAGEPECEACGRSYTAKMEIQFSGAPYWPTRLGYPLQREGIAMDSSPLQEPHLCAFRLGSLCFQRTHLYHSLLHFKLHCILQLHYKTIRIKDRFRRASGEDPTNEEVVQEIIDDSDSWLSGRYGLFEALQEMMEAFGTMDARTVKIDHSKLDRLTLLHQGNLHELFPLAPKRKPLAKRRKNRIGSDDSDVCDRSPAPLHQRHDNSSDSEDEVDLTMKAKAAISSSPVAASSSFSSGSRSTKAKRKGFRLIPGSAYRDRKSSKKAGDQAKPQPTQRQARLAQQLTSRRHGQLYREAGQLEVDIDSDDNGMSQKDAGGHLGEQSESCSDTNTLSRTNRRRKHRRRRIKPESKMHTSDSEHSVSSNDHISTRSGRGTSKSGDNRNKIVTVSDTSGNESSESCTSSSSNSDSSSSSSDNCHPVVPHRKRNGTSEKALDGAENSQTGKSELEEWNDGEFEEDEEELITADGRKIYKVDALLQKRYNSRDRCFEYLVKWSGYDSDQNSWEPPENLFGIQEMIDQFEVRFSSSLQVLSILSFCI